MKIVKRVQQSQNNRKTATNDMDSRVSRVFCSALGGGSATALLSADERGSLFQPKIKLAAETTIILAAVTTTKNYFQNNETVATTTKTDITTKMCCYNNTN